MPLDQVTSNFAEIEAKLFKWKECLDAEVGATVAQATAEAYAQPASSAVPESRRLRSAVVVPEREQQAARTQACSMEAVSGGTQGQGPLMPSAQDGRAFFQTMAASVDLTLAKWDAYKQRCGLQSIQDRLTKRTAANFSSECEQWNYVTELLCYCAFEQEREPLPRNQLTATQKSNKRNKHRGKGQGKPAEGEV